MRSPLRELAAFRHGAFSTAQGLLCYCRAVLRARVRSGRWLPVFTGTYRLAGSEHDARLLLGAAVLTIGRPAPALPRLPEPTVQLPVLGARGRAHRWIDLG